MEHWWDDTDRGKSKYLKTSLICQSDTWSNTNPTWTTLESYVGLPGRTGAASAMGCSKLFKVLIIVMVVVEVAAAVVTTVVLITLDGLNRTTVIQYRTKFGDFGATYLMLREDERT